MVAIKIMYIANIIVAGWISLVSISDPKLAATSVFTNAYQNTEVIRLVGCLWLAIATVSLLGLAYPATFSPILIVQLIYKSVWLLFVALPAVINNKPYPFAMAIFFVIWVIMLPFIIPWKNLFAFAN